MIALEKLLGMKLAEFLDADYPYTMIQIPSSIKPHLYKGLATADSDTGCSSSGAAQDPSLIPKATETADSQELSVHPVKGGKRITDYLTFDW